MIYKHRYSAGILEQLEGSWRFIDSSIQEDHLQLVDINATNDALVLGNHGLRDYTGISPYDARIPSVEALSAQAEGLDPAKIALILLCAGLGSRSKGLIHPLLPIADPRTGQTKTLLDIQLYRLCNSPFSAAQIFILTSPINADLIRSHVSSSKIPFRPEIYECSFVPRLLPEQSPCGAPLPYIDGLGQQDYNPAGHFDALRSFICQGLLSKLKDMEVLIISSYTNASPSLFYGTDTLQIAQFAANIPANSNTIFTAEVTGQSSLKKKGSMLAERQSFQDGFRLIKYSYGSGAPCLGEKVLMSTNTLYFPVQPLIQRLLKEYSAMELHAPIEKYFNLLEAAYEGRIEAQATSACIFDRAFPVRPYLTLKESATGAKVLQVERDLDQLSLLDKSSPILAVHVGSHRNVSIKLPETLLDPRVIDMLFKDYPQE